MMQRPALTGAERLRLVGVTSLTGAPVRSGSHIVSADGSGGSQGHVTSAAYCVERGEEIALALVSGGHARHGEELVATDPLRGSQVPVALVPPVFIDPDNARARS